MESKKRVGVVSVKMIKDYSTQYSSRRVTIPFESIGVTLRDRKNIDVPHSVSEWLIAVNYKYKNNLEVEQRMYKDDISKYRYNNKSLITENQVNLLNIKSKNKNRDKVVRMLN
nr:hypothetical protein NZ312_16250 [Clostridioides difficile]